jgi:hypothetical protein
MAHGLMMPVIPVTLSFWVMSITYAQFLALLVVLHSGAVFFAGSLSVPQQFSVQYHSG